MYINLFWIWFNYYHSSCGLNFVWGFSFCAPASTNEIKCKCCLTGGWNKCLVYFEYEGGCHGNRRGTYQDAELNFPFYFCIFKFSIYQIHPNSRTVLHFKSSVKISQILDFQSYSSNFLHAAWPQRASELHLQICAI